MPGSSTTRNVCTALGLTSKSRQRDRRPTLEELDKLLPFFGNRLRDQSPCRSSSTTRFSTQRQDKITRQTFGGLDEAQPDIWVRDMKHPGEALGNDVRCGLTPEALAVSLNRRKEVGKIGLIFPYDNSTISRVFTDACPHSASRGSALPRSALRRHQPPLRAGLEHSQRCDRLRASNIEFIAAMHAHPASQ